MSRRALVTLHDVAPATLERCRRTLDALARRSVEPVTLLVVPGAEWSPGDLDVLRRLAERYPLAGHGWSHRAVPPGDRTRYHRAHALVISRDEGEHLSRTAAEIRDLVRRCANWFRDVGLDVPSLYVPPAWGLGRLTAADMAGLPFRYYETLTGIHDADAGAFRRLPLVGYLADTPVRVRALRALNRFNRAAARIMRRPLRVSIHPPDLELGLGHRLLRLLEADWAFVTTAEALGSHAEPGAIPGGLRARGTR